MFWQLVRLAWQWFLKEPLMLHRDTEGNRCCANCNENGKVKHENALSYYLGGYCSTDPLLGIEH